MGVTGDLALVVASGVSDRLTARSKAMASRSILDWLGCAISGSRSDAARCADLYADASSRRGEGQVVAGHTYEYGTAAWLNGIRGHIDDFDDSGSHPASYLTPTALAVGELVHASGAEVMEAWITGYEIAMRIASGIRPDRGWHTTPLYGTLGAAATAARLLELSRDQVEMAFGIAGSGTAGLMGNFGSMSKALHPANAARTGIESARLASCGYESASGVIERRYGLVDCFGGEKAHIPSIGVDLSGPLMIDRQPPAIKAWPNCTGTHRSLTGIFALVGAEGIGPADIAHVEHFGPVTPGEGPLQYSEVTAPLQGKFSLEYTLAAALIDGQVDHDTYTADRFNQGDIQQLMGRIHRSKSPDADLYSARIAETMNVDSLVIELKDGRTFDLKLGPRRVLEGAEVEAKFLANAARGRTAESPEALLSVFRNIDREASIKAMMSMVAFAEDQREESEGV